MKKSRLLEAFILCLLFTLTIFFSSVNAETTHPSTSPEEFFRSNGIDETTTLFLACSNMKMVIVDDNSEISWPDQALKVILPKDQQKNVAVIQENERSTCHTYFGTATEFEIYGKCLELIPRQRREDIETFHEIRINRINGEYRGHGSLMGDKVDENIYVKGECIKVEPRF